MGMPFHFERPRRQGSEILMAMGSGRVVMIEMIEGAEFAGKSDTRKVVQQSMNRNGNLGCEWELPFVGNDLSIPRLVDCTRDPTSTPQRCRLSKSPFRYNTVSIESRIMIKWSIPRIHFVGM